MHRADWPARTESTTTQPDGQREPVETALRALPIAGLSRRRFGWLAGIALSLWIVAVFARQVGEASAAADRAVQVRAANDVLASQVAALRRERDVVRQQTFIQFQARAYGLGNAHEQGFTLAANAPALAADAPGSASLALTGERPPQSPLDSWLGLLFGPSR